MCPQTKACYLDHKQVDRDGEAGQLGVCTLRDSLDFEPLPPGLGPAEEALILGGQANLWTELMYFDAQVEYMAFPRLCAISEALWRPRERPNAEDFEARLGAHKARLDRLGVNYFRGPSA
jgi:hexosaminidase